MLNKRGQITIFVIIAILLIVVIGLYFLLRGNLNTGGVPKELAPVYDYFLTCVQEETEAAADLIGIQAGYIETPDFVPGSQYMPFSSQLDFMGFPVPYWYYVSGNNIIEEQVPTKQDMTNQLEKYLDERISECDFSSFEARGFIIEKGEVKTNVQIKNQEIDVKVDMPLLVLFEEMSASKKTHERSVRSNLGEFYDTALNIYNYEKQSMFLEEYGVDVLRLYAPVDGVELSCSPKIWLKRDIDKDLKEALEGNLMAIKLQGKTNDYFVQDLGISEDVNFLYDGSWPTRIEVWDSNNGVLIAKPVGLEQGLGILGFCYVPYHFVYDITYPVLIQVYDETGFVFQFPVAVIIQKNVPRKALDATAVQDAEPELCKYKNQEITIRTYNTDLEPVEADIGFECVKETCEIGKTEINEGDASLTSLFPQCVNGYVTAQSGDYAFVRYLISTNEETEIDMILDKLYNVTLDFNIDNKGTSENAVIIFSSEENTQTALWPFQKEVRLREGLYNVSVYSYKDSSITIPGFKQEQCSEVPKSGILGIFGATEEKCINVDFPSQTISNVITGGGKSEVYLIDDELEKGKIKVNVDSFPLPKSLEDLQEAYTLLEIKPVYIE